MLSQNRKYHYEPMILPYTHTYTQRDMETFTDVYICTCGGVCVFFFSVHRQGLIFFNYKNEGLHQSYPEFLPALECWQTQKCPSFCNLPKPTKNNTSERQSRELEIRYSTGESRIINYIYHTTHAMKSHLINVHSPGVVSVQKNCHLSK